MKTTSILLIFLVLISFSYEFEYEYNYLDDEDPSLQFNFLGILKGFIRGQINNLRSPDFWRQKLQEQFAKFVKNQFTKLAERVNNKNVNSPEEYGEAIRECDRKINKDNHDIVVRIRTEVGLPLNVPEFCRNNPQYRGIIHNDFDYLDKLIYKDKPKTGKYYDDRRKMEEMIRVLNNMQANLEKCWENPFIV